MRDRSGLRMHGARGGVGIDQDVHRYTMDKIRASESDDVMTYGTGEAWAAGAHGPGQTNSLAWTAAGDGHEQGVV
jgi:hypothetical protein